MSAQLPSASSLELPRVVPLSSGRDLVIRSGPNEVLEVRSPSGEVEVSIVLTEAGPVLKVTGGRLEMHADALSLKGREISIETSELTTISSAGEVVVQGAMIRLN